VCMCEDGFILCACVYMYSECQRACVYVSAFVTLGFLLVCYLSIPNFSNLPKFPSTRSRHSASLARLLVRKRSPAGVLLIGLNFEK
jgi:hypothetical protein